MSKKIFKAAIGVSLIAAFVFYKGYFSNQHDWKGEFRSSSQGTFAFGGNGQDSLKTSSDYSGELLVESKENYKSFQWINPTYHLSFGITGSINSEPKSKLFIFLSQPWQVSGGGLKVSSLVNSLGMDEKLLALNLIRKISLPFISVVKDSASESNIVVADYSSNKIHLYEQSGGSYKSPWSVTESTFNKNGSKAKISADLIDSVDFSIELDQGLNNEVHSLSLMSKGEIFGKFKYYKKNSAIIKRLLMGKLIDFKDFEKELRKFKAGDLSYRAAIITLIEIANDESIQIILNEFERQKKNQLITELILYSTLSLKQINSDFFSIILKMAQEKNAKQNIKLIACHFTGLFSEKFPNDPNKLSFIKDYLSPKAEHLSCLGNSGINEAEKLISDFLNDQDIEIRKQALYSLRFIQTPSALQLLMNALKDEQMKITAQEAIKARLERGVFEKALWSQLLEELRNKSKLTEFATKTGKSFIMNFPGAFRDSKADLIAPYFW